MSSTTNFLAIYLGDKTGARMAAWGQLSEAERNAKMQEGIAAWKAWGAKHKDAIVDMGGPLGKTKKIGPEGVEDISNALTGYSIVRAASPEAAAKMFENHPHFTIFPGAEVQIMPVMPIPAG